MSRLFGHVAAVDALLDAMRSDRLHHAWLLAGPQGVGKATFAVAAARRLLAEASGPAPRGNGLHVPEDHPVAALLNAGSHPDFKMLSRLPRERTEELARSVTVDQVRSLQPMFATTPSLSPRRVVVVDAIDDLERNAANALLKNLEEPPAGTVFLLVSHAPGRLLPTIRSRCRTLRLGPLDEAATRAVLRVTLSEAEDAEIEGLVRVAAGVPGAALRFAGLDIASLDAAIERLALHGDPGNTLRTTLARSLAGKGAQSRYEAFLHRAPARIAAAARTLPADAIGAVVLLWRQARDIADRAVAQSLDPQTTAFEIAGLVARLAPAGPGAKA